VGDGSLTPRPLRHSSPLSLSSDAPYVINSIALHLNPAVPACPEAREIVRALAGPVPFFACARVNNA